MHLRSPSGDVPGKTRRQFLRAVGAGIGAGAFCAEGAATVPKPPALSFSQAADSLQLRLGTQEILRYQLKKPAQGAASAASACYFHPLTTPSGTVVTEVGAPDHTHHRGVFLAWVEMKGKKAADFWGWGVAAPVAHRQIVNRKVEAPPPVLGFPKFRIVNEWIAERERLLTEDLRVGVNIRGGMTGLDIAVQLTPDSPLTLARWAFSGFAMRTPVAGEVIPIGPNGRVTHPAPRHDRPETNWPDLHWYGFHLKMPHGKEATVAIANRKANPATTWHVVPGIGLLNPSITAPAPVEILPTAPLILRYRVMAFDGPPDMGALNELGEAWFNG
jgi:hypothetical protein